MRARARTQQRSAISEREGDQAFSNNEDSRTFQTHPESARTFDPSILEHSIGAHLDAEGSRQSAGGEKARNQTFSHIEGSKTRQNPPEHSRPSDSILPEHSIRFAPGRRGHAEGSRQSARGEKARDQTCSPTWGPPEPTRTL